MDRPQGRHCSAEISESVVRAGASGDRDALQQIYDVTVDRVYRLMLRMVGQNEASDLTQQVYLRAFSKLSQFSGAAKFETWLYRVASNEALQFLRARRRREFEPLLIEPACEPSDAVSVQEQSEVLQRALEKLDEDLRMVLVLKEQEGLSYDEIASVMEIPSGTVGSRLNRARRALRKLLE